MKTSCLRFSQLSFGRNYQKRGQITKISGRKAGIVFRLPGNTVQGDHSACGEPPVDFKTKVPFWPGLAWTSQAKAELLF